jgi:hypothetical protein
LGETEKKINELSTTITISKSNAKFAIAISIGALVGLLLGWVLFSHPPFSSSTVPPAALKAAYKAGSAILEGTAPTSLPMDVFTETFLYSYQADFDAIVYPMRTTNLAWTGTPVVTWAGNNFIDVCLLANTQAGTMAIELRMVRNGKSWAVDQLLLIQLREGK